LLYQINVLLSQMEHQVTSPGVVQFDVGGRQIRVDEDIFHSLVVHYKWSLRSGYVTAWTPMRAGKRTLLFLHREIMRPNPDQEVHFRNHSPLDDRRANLEVVTHAESKHWSRRKPKTTEQRLQGLYKFADSKNWWFRYTQDGKRHTVPLRTEDEGEAVTRARAILAEGLIATEAYTPNEPTPRRREVHGLIEQYLEESQSRTKDALRKVTADTRRYILQKFVADAEINRAGEITGAKIAQWLVQLKRDGKSRDTLWTYGERVRNFVKYLMPKYAPPTALDGFTVPDQPTTGRRNWVRSAEVTKLIDAASDDPTLQFALFCGFDAGLRRNEISEAKVEWFDLENNLLHVAEHKNFVPKDRDNRTIALTERFAEFLKGYLAGRKNGEYVLAPEKTVKVQSKYRYDTAKRVRSHFTKCKVNASFHDMRRSFGSNRASAGESIYIIAAWLGDTMDVVQRSYGHLAPQAGNINRGV
jgi:integrase